MEIEFNRIALEEAASTNTWLSQHIAGLPSMTVVTARAQIAGRGQRGNSWESEPGKNLTMSLLWRPENFAARRQFAASEAVALAVVDTLSDFGVPAKVKWPNDIYVGDRKIAGILIEHAVGGRDIMHTIVGIGLNVNQTVFVSDAPNPVSMARILGMETDVEDVLKSLLNHLSRRLADCMDEDTAGRMHAEYMTEMWRADGRPHQFSLPDGTRFEAAIAGVAPDGMLSLIDTNAVTRAFAFKEVSFIL